MEKEGVRGGSSMSHIPPSRLPAVPDMRHINSVAFSIGFLKRECKTSLFTLLVWRSLLDAVFGYRCHKLMYSQHICTYQVIPVCRRRENHNRTHLACRHPQKYPHGAGTCDVELDLYL